MSVVAFVCYLNVSPAIIPTQENSLNTFLSKHKHNIIQRFPKQKPKNMVGLLVPGLSDDSILEASMHRIILYLSLTTVQLLTELTCRAGDFQQQ
jgi:hypothetical protein